MNEKTINQIVESIIDLLPENWEEVSARAIIDQKYYEIYFYVKVSNSWIQCYQLPDQFDVSEDEIDDLFSKMYALCKQSQEQNKWSAFSLTFNSDGEFSLDYEYEEPSLLQDWKKEYLR